MEVLEDHHHGAGVGEALEERSPGAEELLGTHRRIRRRGGRAGRGSIQRRSASSGTCCWTPGRELLARGLVVVRLEQPGALADHLAERPEGDALAVRRASGRRASRRSRQAVDVLQELPRQPALADAAGADDGDEPRPPIATGGVEEILEQAHLVVTADERRLQRVRPRSRPPRSATTRIARHAVTGASLPLSDLLAERPRTRSRSRAARCVASPTSTVPGCAAPWSRLAVLTRSPATMPWFVAPMVTAASPVSTPARAWIPGAQAS